MPKHAQVEMTLLDIINHMGEEDSCEWWLVMNIEIEGIKNSMNDKDFDLTCRLQDEYLRSHETDLYRVSWPEHVLTPKFNSDANYQ